MKRLLAVAVAVGLVVGAVLVRRVMDDDAAGGTPTLVCATEVRAACERLGGVTVRVEAAGITTDRLGNGEPLGADGWLVASFWPQMLNRRTSDPLGQTAVAVVATARGAEALRPCGTTWKCVGDQAATVPVGIPSVDTSSGLASVTAAVAGRTGGPAVIVDELDDDGQSWFRRFASGVPPAPALPPVESLVVLRGSYDIAAGLETELRGKPQRLGIPPALPVQVALAGNADRFDLDALTGALRATGWHKPSANAELPDSGVMEALRDSWKENAR